MGGIAVGTPGYSQRLMAWMERWAEGLRASDLAAFRIVFAGVTLLWVLPDWSWIADLPGSWFAPPPGPFALLPAAPPAWALTVLEVTTALLLGALLVGVRTRLVSLVLPCLLLLGSGLSYSWGKIDHSVLLLFVPLFLGPAGWGDALSVDALRDRRPVRERRWPVTLLALTVAVAMSNAALSKATSGWLFGASDAVQGHLIVNYVVQARDELLASWAVGLSLGPFWKLLDVATVLVEAAPLVALLLAPRRWFRLTLVGLALFHVSVLLFMNIGFESNLLAYLAFFAWPATGPLQRAFERVGPTGATMVGLGLGAVVGASLAVPDLAPRAAVADLLGVSSTVLGAFLVLALAATAIGLEVRERRLRRPVPAPAWR